MVQIESADALSTKLIGGNTAWDIAPSKRQKLAVIFGNEVKGVQQEVIDECTDVIEIPQVGTKHSLNIAVSVGIVMWDLFQKLT